MYKNCTYFNHIVEHTYYLIYILMYCSMYSILILMKNGFNIENIISLSIIYIFVNVYK